jgi:hypothetical protein
MIVREAVLAPIAPTLAPMVVVPIAIPVARPDVPMAATVGFSEVHDAEDVRFCVEPSEKVPTASNCTEEPVSRVDIGGEIARLTSTGGGAETVSAV